MINMVAVDKGALQMVTNVMRRAEKNEPIDALLATCIDIEKVLAWYAANKPAEYMRHVTATMINNHT